MAYVSIALGLLCPRPFTAATAAMPLLLSFLLAAGSFNSRGRLVVCPSQLSVWFGKPTPIVVAALSLSFLLCWAGSFPNLGRCQLT